MGTDGRVERHFAKLLIFALKPIEIAIWILQNVQTATTGQAE
jgi:hypothetical protein